LSKKASTGRLPRQSRLQYLGHFLGDLIPVEAIETFAPDTHRRALFPCAPVELQGVRDCRPIESGRADAQLVGFDEIFGLAGIDKRQDRPPNTGFNKGAGGL